MSPFALGVTVSDIEDSADVATVDRLGQVAVQFRQELRLRSLLTNKILLHFKPFLGHH